ncbi:hypothetical protein SAMN05414139_03710 [Burkholderia sp. D7]|nr:hypothetical protein SAMN05414139_03710 [Burkholderia sp. D7]
MQLSAGRGQARGVAPRNSDRLRDWFRLRERDDCDEPQAQERLRGAGHRPMRHEA